LASILGSPGYAVVVVPSVKKSVYLVPMMWTRVKSVGAGSFEFGAEELPLGASALAAVVEVGELVEAGVSSGVS
jgi:hypothetical protein